MVRIRNLIRWFFAVICLGLVLAVVGAMLGEFLIEWARHHGFYASAPEKLDAVMNAFSAFVTQPWFLAATAAFVGLTVGIWLDWGLRRIGANRSAVLPHPAVPTAQVAPPRAVSSKFGKMIFSCNDPRTGEGQDIEQWRKDFEQAARVWGDAHGLSIKATILEDGYKFEFRGKTVETAARWLGLTWTLEARRASRDNVIVVSYLEWETLNIGGIDYAATINPILKMVPIDPDAESSIRLAKYIAGLLQLDESQCKII
jgi:hypothetical protein